MSIPIPLKIQQGVTAAIMLPTTLADVTGWKFAAQIRASSSSDEVLAEWLDGQIEAHPYALIMPIDPAVSSRWTWSRAVFGIEAMSPAGQVIRLLQTPIALDRELVRPMFPEVTA